MRTYIRHPKNPNISCYLVETTKVSKGGLHKTSIYPINYYPNSRVTASALYLIQLDSGLSKKEAILSVSTKFS